MEDCKACAILKEALEFERAQNRELIETLTSLLKPQPINQVTNVVDPTKLRPVGIPFSRRRRELEQQERLRAEAENSPHRARPDNEIKRSDAIAKLEQELGVVDSEHIDKPELQQKEGA